MYIGKQKILQEEEIGNGFVRVTLKSITFNGQRPAGLGETEDVVYQEDVLKDVKSKKEATDLAELRDIRCKSAAGEMIGILLKYAIKLDDIPNALQAVEQSINYAKEVKNRKVFGVDQSNITLYQLKDELLGK